MFTKSVFVAFQSFGGGDTEWAHPKTKELGGAPALGGSMFAVAHLLGDRELRDLGWSQVNFVFGVNSVGTPLDAQFPRPGTLLATAGEATAGQADHIGQNAYATEGWGVSNRGWMTTLTFAPLGTQKIRVLDAAGKKPMQTGKVGQAVTLELTAALNQNPTKQEAGWVLVSVGGKGLIQLPMLGTMTVSYGYWGLGVNAICQIR